MSLQDVFNIAVVIFTVTNIGALGLETNLREATKTLYSSCRWRKGTRPDCC
jgi:hypothetical protein